MKKEWVCNCCSKKAQEFADEVVLLDELEQENQDF